MLSRPELYIKTSLTVPNEETRQHVKSRPPRQSVAAWRGRNDRRGHTLNCPVDLEFSKNDPRQGAGENVDEDLESRAHGQGHDRLEDPGARVSVGAKVELTRDRPGRESRDLDSGVSSLARRTQGVEDTHHRVRYTVADDHRINNVQGHAVLAERGDAAIERHQRQLCEAEHDAHRVRTRREML